VKGKPAAIGTESPTAVASPRRTVAFGGGLRVPYPEPKTAAASRVGQGNHHADTKPEQALRSELHRRGLRFRKDFLIRCDEVRIKPGIVFTRARVAVFVDGCSWHSCPERHIMPKNNSDYWLPKFGRDLERDRRADEALVSAGWTVIRVSEHEAVATAPDRVEKLLTR